MSGAWPLGESPEGPPVAVPQAAPGTYPVPQGRGRWRLTLHNRAYGVGVNWMTQIIVELTDARSRNLEQKWSSSATLTFTINGRSPAAAYITEMAQEVVAWRWDDQSGKDIPVFRGVITQCEDQITEQAYTLNVTCKDYIAMMSRRVVSTATPIVYTQMDQDLIAGNILLMASANNASPNRLPMSIVYVDSAGANRGLSGTLRDRSYLGQTVPGDAFDALSKVSGGFDYDVRPNAVGQADDQLRIFFPWQGVLRSTPELIYGSTISSLTRTVNSADYANHWRVLGNNGNSDQTAPQYYAECWDQNSLIATPGSFGLWASADNEADVTVVQTLVEKAGGSGLVTNPQGGLLGQSSIVSPTYSLTLRPGIYTCGNPNMGDTCPLVVITGRLHVNTSVRIVGINYVIGDDGDEQVQLTVGRPDVTFADLFTSKDRNIDALSRR